MSADMVVQLANGIRMPMIGLGTWLSRDKATLCAAIRAAVDAGYRMFDTAYLYQTEEGVGEGLQQCMRDGKVKRDELFVTTKLPFTAHAPADVKRCVEEQLQRLKLDYVDLYLIHTPCPVKHKPDDFTPLIQDGSFVVDDVDLMETWRVLEELYKEKKLHAIGLSNFNEEQIESIYKKAEIKPSNLQIEMHAYFPQTELHKYCKERNISVTAYAPLGSPGRKAFNPNGFWPEGEPIKDPVIKDIALRHRKSPAQILLRYLVQKGVIVIPKSTNVKHIEENIRIFDFDLSADDCQRIDNIGERRRLFVFDYFAHHPNYPMMDQDRTKFKKVAFESF